MTTTDFHAGATTAPADEHPSSGILTLQSTGSPIVYDGTKVRANASRHKAMSYARLTEKQKVLAAEVSDLLERANATDKAEDTRFGKDKRGDELPAELARRESRLAAMAQARKSLEDEAAARAREEAQEKSRERGDDAEVSAANGADAADKAEVRSTAQRNFTDPDARIMKTAGNWSGCGGVQQGLGQGVDVTGVTGVGSVCRAGEATRPR